MSASPVARKRASASPKSPALRLSPDERREHLLGCAIKVFAAHGLMAANHAKVAAQAHVSVPTVVFYFNTREALVDAVLTEVEHFYTSAFTRIKNAKGPADQVLMEGSRAMTQTLETHQDYGRIMQKWSVSVRSDFWPR